MCTLVILRRPGHPWPLLIGANRDEMRGRPTRPPGRHWPDRPEILAGLDELAGGSWLGVSDHGLAAAVLNRHGTLGPATGKRSRGELVLDALDHLQAEEAADALGELDPSAYRAFNLIVADIHQAFWLRRAGQDDVTIRPIPDGLHMIDAGELDDPNSPKIIANLAAFAAVPPDPAAGDWTGWQRLFASHVPGQGDRDASLCVRRDNGYGTVSSSLIAIPADPGIPTIWLHADGPPDVTPYRPIEPS